MDLTPLLATATEDPIYRHRVVGECLECKLNLMEMMGGTPFVTSCGKAMLVGDADDKERCPECLSAEQDAEAFEMRHISDTEPMTPIETCGFCGADYTLEASVTKLERLLATADPRAFALLVRARTED